MTAPREIIPLTRPLDCIVTVPGSKSITNRALILAAMARGKSSLTNAIFSDDSRALIDCLGRLGYDISTDETAKKIEIRGGAPGGKASVNVGSAGTAARFLTAMLAAHEGEYTIDASEQMKKRPMKALFDTLADLGCRIEYLGAEGHLPCRLRGGRLCGGEVVIDASQSSQFTSALLMCGHLHQNDLIIRP